MFKCGISAILVFVNLIQFVITQSQPSQHQPLVEKPLLLDSYLPAGMQVIAHYTDLMKYELRPADGLSTTTTLRPTPPHGPAVYAPTNPLGFAAYFAKNSNYEEYIQRLKDREGIVSYFDRYNFPFDNNEQGRRELITRYEPVPPFAKLELRSERSHVVPEGNTKNKDSGKTPPQPLPRYREERVLAYDHQNNDNLPEDLELLGLGPSALIKQVNRIDDYDFVDDDENTVRRFSDNYDDDADVRSFVVGQKKVPPTKAYVALLFLYDQLNKEAKKIKLNKYGGYTDEVVRVLADTSTGTAANQLRTILSKIVTNRDITDQQIIKKINELLLDLEKSDSYLNDALRYLPPLQFAP